MRVLITTDTIGGVWTFTQELTAGLLEQQCDVALFSVGGLPKVDHYSWAGEMEESWNGRFRFHSSNASLEWMQDNDFAFTEPAPSLLCFAEEFGADVIHSNQFCFGALPISTPKILTAHSDVLSWSACCALTLEDSAWLTQYRSLVSDGLEEADAVVAPTKWMLDQVGQNFPLPELRLVVPNGREVGPCLNQRGRKLQAVSAGRLWDEGKNVAVLCDLDSPVPILIAGDTRYETATAPAQLGDAKLQGALSQRDLLALFWESAIYICTSRYEPFGLAPLEAALCGCAVLANDIPSLREVWGEAALYFNSAQGLGALLSSLHADGELLTRVRARSLARARQLSREAMVAGYMSIYTAAAARKREIANVA